jgi:hypothetical protein
VRNLQPFGTVCDLVPLADTVTKLSAICTACKSEAAFSQRLTADMSAIAIGGAEMYVPACRSCFLTPRSPSEAAASPAAVREPCDGPVNQTPLTDDSRKHVRQRVDDLTVAPFTL